MKNKLIRARLLEFARKRGKSKTFCPSEIARSIDKENWRDLMHSVKLEGKKMVNENLLQCTQKGKPLDPLHAKGPIRFGLPSHCSSV
ncbi:MAG: DUF3253 domain-containing protein [Verrucomicrobiota bacterium]|jgi:hypothetical protein|nr:DUF3253 domain-containing protein [Verrucomicrobiota bacterium]